MCSGIAFFSQVKSGYTVKLSFREAGLMDCSTINRSIPASVGASGMITAPYPWCGPMIAMRETASEIYEDITLADFRHTLDHLTSYGTTETKATTRTAAVALRLPSAAPSSAAAEKGSCTARNASSPPTCRATTPSARYARMGAHPPSRGASACL